MNATRALHGLTWRLLAVFCLLVAATKVSGAFHGYVYNGTPGFEVARWFLESSSYDVVFYTPTLLAVIAVNNLVTKDSGRTILTLAIAIALGNVVGFPLSDGIRHALESNPSASSDEPARSSADTLINYAAGWLEGCLWSAAAAILYFFVVREGEAAESLHREELDRIGLDRQMTEARLQVMQAQIEPHFLFNTLANVRRLYQTEPETGRTMLQHLRRYLSAALPQMREAQSTLGRWVRSGRA